MSGASHFEFVDGVTGDLTFVARGETIEDLFAAAVEAVLAAAVENPDAVRARTRCTVGLSEPDIELLLLGLCNEVVFQRDARSLLLRPERIEVHEADDGASLDAVLVGEPIDPERHVFAADVKAATAYGLRVERAPGGWEARVTLDV